ncbi:hypothetical protein U8V72_14720 [Priestia filamentosa]|uniref:hypothetical protein n=1 Tax=Priestia filamentosa TaxID=1402861 RepID=UPI0005895607
MYHLFVLFLCIILVMVSKFLPFLPHNIEISLMILGVIAFVRYVIERDMKKFELLIETAKKIENSGREKAQSGIVKEIIPLQGEAQMLPGFYDFYIVFEDGKEIILSTSKQTTISMLKRVKSKARLYYLDGIIIDIEPISDGE